MIVLSAALNVALLMALLLVMLRAGGTILEMEDEISELGADNERLGCWIEDLVESRLQSPWAAMDTKDR